MSNIQNIRRRQRETAVQIEQERLPIPDQVTPPYRRPGGTIGILQRAKTQEAAQADLLISVKLLDGEDNEIGDAFDATFISTDGCTAANAALPRVQTAKTVIVSKVGGTWYVINPTIIDSEAC